MQLSVAGAAESRAVRFLRTALDVGLYGFAFFLAMGIAPTQIALGVVLGAVIGLHLLGVQVLRPTALDRPIAFYLLALLIGAVAERAAGASFLASDVLGVWRLGAAVILAGAIGSDPARGFRLAMVFVGAMALQGLYGFAQHFSGIDWTRPGGDGPMPLALFASDRFRVTGSLSRHSTFAFVGATALVVIAGAWVAGALKDGRRRLFAAVAAAPILFSVLFTTVRAAWIGIVAGLVAMAVVGRTLRRVTAALLVLGLFVGVAAQTSEAVQAKLERALDPGFANNSHRGFMWARSMAMLEDHPVTGIGAGTYTPRTRVYYDPHSPQFVVRCHSHNNLLFAWVESGPLGLLALIWLMAAVLSALRRGAKARAAEGAPPETLALIGVAAATVSAVLAWSFVQDPLYDGGIALTIAFAVALGLAASGSAAEPAPADAVLGTPDRAPPDEDGVPAPGTSAAVAAVATAAAAAGGFLDLDAVGPGPGLAAALVLGLLALGHVSGLPGRIGPTLRTLATFAGVVLLAGRPFAAKLLPGTAAWWATPGAAVAVAALVAGLAGAAWAIRRPGQVGAAPVAGAIAFAFAAGWIALNHHLLLEWLGVWEAAMPTSFNFAAGAGAASLLFVAWTGPLGGGEVEARGVARHLVRLPAAVVAAGLAALAATGLL